MLGEIIQGFGNLGGSVISAATTASQNAKDREFNASQAQLNRDWQTEMSNTAYQRAVADMEAAGLNPALIFSQGGSGASTPGGGQASFYSRSYYQTASQVAGALSSLGNAFIQRAEAKQAELTAKQYFDSMRSLEAFKQDSTFKRQIVMLNKKLGFHI